MKRIALTAILISAPSFAATDSIRTYVAYGAFVPKSDKTCFEIEQDFDHAMRPSIADRNRLEFYADAMCNPPNPTDQRPSKVAYQVHLEAKTEDDIALVESYLEEHRDIVIEGHSVRLSPVREIMQDASVGFYSLVDGEESLVDILKVPALLPNLGAWSRAYEEIVRAHESVETFLVWAHAKMNPKDAWWAEALYLLEARAVETVVDITFILEDGRVIPSDKFKKALLECDSLPGSTCLQRNPALNAHESRSDRQARRRVQK